ncbi:MAG: 2-hydroxyacyl-CoA dehydratase [Calditerrivibrio sp.]|nr:2-hydroxyacyl-CoA dehydratase [Calditerrivibrio sp.]MCA1933638.1 2-hydroxyacyl-CoA dehydratase [Calditerrivibrio sp.]MCA1980727.1 2-hydroxyacyl-CoA dehydratase [Calditerrivibrio sp.]
MKRVGFTTTIPVEVILSADKIPVDLNNVFITSESPYKKIDFAEEYGFPKNSCNWIKGIFTAVMEKNVDEVVAVIEGDCSNTHALIEIFRGEGVKVHTFSYPYGDLDKYSFIKREIEQLALSLGGDLRKTQEIARSLMPLRKKLILLDKLTVDGYVSGFENHLWLVSSTDFNSDVQKFERDLDSFLSKAAGRKPIKNRICLGIIGVPTIFTDLYQFLDSKSVSVVFNEVQRQFSMPFMGDDYYQNFLDYTYPYDIFHRLRDIKKEIEERKIDGIIHYVQSFCYRQIQDVVIKKELNIPVITIEGNDPESLDARTKIRLESFIEMLEGRKK